MKKIISLRVNTSGLSFKIPKQMENILEVDNIYVLGIEDLLIPIKITNNFNIHLNKQVREYLDITKTKDVYISYDEIYGIVEMEFVDKTFRAEGTI